MQYHLLVMVLAECNSTYSVCLSHDDGNVYFDFAQTQQHFQIIVQLTHTRPTMSCIHLVLLCVVLYSQLKAYLGNGISCKFH